MKLILKKIRHIKIKTLLMSFAVALFLWLYVKLGDTYKYEIDIPLVPVNIKQGKTLKTELPANITILIEGKGSGMMGLLVLWKSDIKFLLDLSTIEYFWDCELNKYLNWIKLPPGYDKVKIVEITKPEIVSVELDKRIEKLVPVSDENITIIPSEHYVHVGSIDFDPDSVLISGPASKIGKIEKVSTEEHIFKNKKSPFEEFIPLKKEFENLFQYSLDGVNVSADIQILGEKVIDAVDIVINGIPAGFKARVEPGKVNVKIRGGINYINSVDASDIKAEIPWSRDWKRYREYREKLIIKHPNDVISYDELPKIFTVIIE